MNTTRLKAIVAGVLIGAASVAALSVPAQASWGGTGTGITIDKMSQRSVTGGGNYVVSASTSDFVAQPEGGDLVTVNTGVLAADTGSTGVDAGALARTATQTLVVQFECHATAGRDATQTRVVPGGCVLYKGGTVIGSAPGQSLPGPSAATQGTATVGMSVPGPFVLCWNVSATYLLNHGAELFNDGCTQG